MENEELKNQKTSSDDSKKEDADLEKNASSFIYWN